MKKALGGSSISPFGRYQPPSVVLGKMVMPEQFAGAEQFAEEGHQQQDDAVTETVAEAVEETQADRVFHGEAFGPAEHDAVGDDQADEHRQLLADAEGVGLEKLINDDDQGGDDGNLHDDADAARDLFANQADRGVGTTDDKDHRQRHDHHGFQLGGNRQG